MTEHTERVATKADLRQLRADLKADRLQLVIMVVSITVIVVTFAAALLHVGH
jgi:hypothetical protein